MDRFSVTQAIQPKTNDGSSRACLQLGVPGSQGQLGSSSARSPHSGLVLTMIIALADRRTAQDALARELDIELSKLQAADRADAMLRGREAGLADT